MKPCVFCGVAANWSRTGRTFLCKPCRIVTRSCNVFHRLRAEVFVGVINRASHLRARADAIHDLAIEQHTQARLKERRGAPPAEVQAHRAQARRLEVLVGRIRAMWYGLDRNKTTLTMLVLGTESISDDPDFIKRFLEEE